MNEIRILKAIKAFLRLAFVPKAGISEFMEKFITKNYLKPIEKAIADTEKKMKKKPALESKLVALNKRLDGFAKLLKENWNQIAHRVLVRNVRKTGLGLDEEEVLADVAFYIVDEGADVIKKNVKPLKSKPEEILKLFRKIAQVAAMREVDKFSRQQRIKEREDARREKEKMGPAEEVEFQDLLATIIRRLQSFLRTDGDKDYKDLFPDFFKVLLDTVQRGGDVKKAFTNAFNELQSKYDKSKIWFYKKWEDFRRALLEFFRREEKTTGIPAGTVQKVLRISTGSKIWVGMARRLIARWVLGKSIKDELDAGTFVAPKDMVVVLRNKKKKKQYAHIIDKLVREKCHTTTTNAKTAAR
jgi:hypothetical protein